jgi:putative Ca2+/H+ antiporter (TMEM165/GDT1 family)
MRVHLAHMGAFVSMFLLVFVAELGDKTQLTTALSAAEADRPAWLVFLAHSRGRGGIPPVQGAWLKIAAGLGFILMGGVTLWSALRA